MSTITKDLGAVTAYAYAVEQGYTGTEEEFAELMADYAAVEQRAAQSATAAQTSASNASQSASASAQSAYQASASATSASQSAETASTKASEASTSAQTAGAKASEASTSAQTAGAKASEASGYASTASQKASEASQSASQASGYATAAGQSATGAASSAQAAAQSAAEAAESARTLMIDPTLTQSGQAADAKVVGDKITNLQADIDSIDPGLTSEAKDALLACFRYVAWTTEDGQELYQNLYHALYLDARIVSISATFTQGTAKIYTSDSLDALKQYLVVTATDYGGTESVVSDYVLSGTLTEGTSTITVIYGGKTTTFDVTVTGEQTNLLYNWDFTKSLTDSVSGKTATTTATRNSNGLTFDGYGQYIDYDLSFSRDMTFEIDIDYIGTKVEGTTDHDTAYRRLLAFGENGTLTESNTAAFLCSTQSGRPGWWWYLGSAWDSNAISQNLRDVSKYSYFDGKTIKIYVDSTGKCYVYEKTIGASDTTYTLAGQSTNALKAFASAKIYMGGSGNDALASARIKAFRVYEGEK